MSLGSKEYISTQGIGDRLRCLQVMDEIREPLKELYERSFIKGAVNQIFYDIQGLEKEDIEPSLVLALTDGVFPVLWLNITFDWQDNTLSIVDDFARKFEFIEISHFRVNY